jgi:hypothetical protein
MNLGEIQMHLKQAGLDVYVSETRNGKVNIMMPFCDAEAMALKLNPPKRIPAPSQTPLSNPSQPDALTEAQVAAPQNRFVASCTEQWEEKGTLTPKQLEVLALIASR